MASLTDIATGWTECAPLLVREQTVLVAVLDELRKLMPFALLGFDTDNDSVFINETVRDYCASSGVALLRTVQRRLKIWRSEQACALVFARPSSGPSTTAEAALPTMIEG